MEAKLLAGVAQSDTHQRLQVADEMMEYFKNEANSLDEFPEFDLIIGGLAGWMGSSNFRVSISAMEVLALLVRRMKDKFKPHIPTIYPVLRERLGDAKDAVREQAQLLIQKIMVEVVSSPQAFLERIMETSLVHKNWRIKEQGLICLSRTLNYFGSGQVSVSKFMGNICNLLGDANSQVRSTAVETVIEIYRHVGVKVRIDLSRRGLPASRMALLTTKFDEIDQTSNTVLDDRDEPAMDDDRASVGSSSSNTSARTHTSSRSAGSRPRPARPPSALGGGGGSGGVVESDFEKGFEDVPRVNIFTQHDLERVMGAVEATLSDPKKPWETRVNALKELRAVVRLESLDHAHFLSLLRSLEIPFGESLKDLRSQVIREACITLSCISVVLGPDAARCAEQMMPQLIALLPNSARVMASSAEVCVKFIIKHTPTHRLLQALSSQGCTSKSPVTRKHCAEFVSLALHSWEGNILERCTALIEETLRRGVVDADSAARKHMRRAFWGYYGHFPSAAQRLLDSLDPQLQKTIREERERENGGGAAAQPTASILKPPGKRKPPPGPLSSYSESDLLSNPAEPTKLQKALTSIANIAPRVPSSPSHPISPSHTLPASISIRLQRPTIRSPSHARRANLRGSQSVENLDDPPSSPLFRPPSRPSSRSGIRPPSRSGARRVEKKGSVSELYPRRPRTPGMRLSRSAQPSPCTSRESSPPRFSSKDAASLPRSLVASLTTEAMQQLYGFGRSKDEEDDNGSVTSERSTFSFSSEVSVSPYTRYTNPITDLNELVVLCSSQQWSERRDGIAQLHMLLESPRPFSHADMQRVRAVFKRLLSEPHAKVYSMFLDTLSRFIEEHREYLDDWVFLLLLRLLHRQGSDMLSSIHYKLQLVLELARKSFEVDQQFHSLCRILTDQTQPMNHKVKLAWLEYFIELIPALDSAGFRDTTEIRQAMSKLLSLTSEPKSSDIRRQSTKAVIALFELNPATFTLMLRSVTKPLQESANRILRGHMQDQASSSDEETPPLSPAPSGRKSSQGLASTPKSRGSRIPAPSPSPSPRPSSRLRSTTPSQLMGLGGSRAISSSSPDMREVKESEPRTPSRSRIPTPSRSGYSGIPRPCSTTPGASPSTARRRVFPAPPRAQSVDPERMAERLQQHQQQQQQQQRRHKRQSSEGAVKRPSSARSNYTPMRYQNGASELTIPNDSAEHFSFSDLPNLDFGSPDDKEEFEPFSPIERDQIAMVLREIQTASSSKLRYASLQSLFTLAREYPDRCKWEEHFKPTLLMLVETMGDEDTGVRTVSLRVLREMLKTQHDRLRDFAELTTLKVLKSFADSDVSVSQAAEDLFTLLAPALPSQSAIELLAPMAAKEKHPMLLGTIKLLTKVITLAETSYLEGKLKDVVPGVIRGYSHSESSVRKASVFCLVAIHSVVGEKVQEHLTKLTSSQTKLLDLYIKRHQQQAASRGTQQQNGPKR